MQLQAAALMCPSQAPAHPGNFGSMEELLGDEWGGDTGGGGSSSSLDPLPPHSSKRTGLSAIPTPFLREENAGVLAWGSGS